MISTRQKGAVQHCIDSCAAEDELNAMENPRAFAALMFTTPELLKARLMMTRPAADIALDHFRAVKTFIAATGWKPPDKPKPFRFDM